MLKPNLCVLETARLAQKAAAEFHVCFRKKQFPSISSYPSPVKTAGLCECIWEISPIALK